MNNLKITCLIASIIVGSGILASDSYFADGMAVSQLPEEQYNKLVNQQRTVYLYIDDKVFEVQQAIVKKYPVLEYYTYENNNTTNKYQVTELVNKLWDSANKLNKGKSIETINKITEGKIKVDEEYTNVREHLLSIIDNIREQLLPSIKNKVNINYQLTNIEDYILYGSN